MSLDSWIATAKKSGASDLHLEPGLPPAIRVRGALRTAGEPLPAGQLLASAQEIIGTAQWPLFLERKSFDCSRTIQGVRCRINILQTSRGIGFAVRLLSTFQATLESLNLHPDLIRLIAPSNGLVLISGRTGSGKSSTLAALIQEINLTENRHIVTIESPIEYSFQPRHAYIRQREVGRDTPSFEQALLDALREDPDVLMVGEMREPETMRLTLNAAETGHLVLATVHASTCAEALQRIVSAFPSDAQSPVCAQLADCLVGVVAQRLVYRADLGIRLPELELLTSHTAVKAHIRSRDFFKIMPVMETGAEKGMWTFARYRTWMERKNQWHVPDPNAAFTDGETVAPPPAILSAPVAGHAKSAPAAAKSGVAKPAAPAAGPRPIEIEPVEGGLEALLKKLE